MAEQIIEWNDVKSFVRRRRRSFFISASIIFLSSIIVAFTLPPTYRGETTVLIEEQQIPESFVQSTITAYAEERLNTIKQQVFSSDRLKEIITTLAFTRKSSRNMGWVKPSLKCGSHRIGNRERRFCQPEYREIDGGNDCICVVL